MRRVSYPTLRYEEEGKRKGKEREKKRERDIVFWGGLSGMGDGYVDGV